MMRVVVDTNVLFEGLTKKDGAADLIVQAWLARLFEPCYSDTLMHEYYDVLSRKLSKNRWEQAQPILGELLQNGRQIRIYYRWRPSSPDLADEHVIDCAMNANATVVTYNVKDFRLAQRKLGLQLLNPVEFARVLTKVAR